MGTTECDGEEVGSGVGCPCNATAAAVRTTGLVWRKREEQKERGEKEKWMDGWMDEGEGGCVGSREGGSQPR